MCTDHPACVFLHYLGEVNCQISTGLKTSTGFILEDECRIYQMVHFRWPWVAPNLHFKVTIFFNVKSKMVQDIEDKAILQ